MEWILYESVTLTNADKEVILTEEELNDMHIDISQRVLSNQFSSFSGFGSTMVLHCVRGWTNKHIEIFHCMVTTGLLWVQLDARTGKLMCMIPCIMILIMQQKWRLKSICYTHCQVQSAFCSKTTRHKGLRAICHSFHHLPCLWWQSFTCCSTWAIEATFPSCHLLRKRILYQFRLSKCTVSDSLIQIFFLLHSPEFYWIIKFQQFVFQQLLNKYEIGLQDTVENWVIKSQVYTSCHETIDDNISMWCKVGVRFYCPLSCQRPRDA